MTVLAPFQAIRQHVVAVKAEAAYRRMLSLHLRRHEQIAQAVTMYHDSVHIESYANRVWHQVLTPEHLSAVPANDFAYNPLRPA